MCPGGVEFATRSASGGRGAVLVANSTRPVITVRRSDETWLPEWSGKLGGVKRCAVRSRGRSWGKPVFRLTASSPLAESLAWGRVANFSATEGAHKRNEGRIDAEWRLAVLVTIPGGGGGQGPNQGKSSEDLRQIPLMIMGVPIQKIPKNIDAVFMGCRFM